MNGLFYGQTVAPGARLTIKLHSMSHISQVVTGYYGVSLMLREENSCMRFTKDIVSVSGAERARESSGWRILLKTATLSTAAVAFYLLLRHTFLPRTFASHPDLIVVGIILLWTWPVYSLIRRQTAYARAQDPPTNPDESELQMLRAVIDSLPDLIYFKDTESRFLLANPAQRKFISGDPERNVVGLTDSSFFPEENARAFFNDEQEIIRSGDAGREPG